MDEDQCRQGGDNEASEDCRGTVLERVLSSLCSYHRILFYHMLQDIREDHRESLALRDAHRRLSKTEPHCCHTGRKPPDETSMCPAGSTCAACLTTCRLRTCAVTSVCVCMKTLTGLACQNVALGCVGKVICPSCTVCFAHHKILACQHQHNGDDADNTHAGKKRSVIQPPGHLSQDACAGCRSPSPPPLSPVPIDADFKMSEKNMGCCGQERSTPPPPLLPHRTETEVQHSRTVPGGATCPPVVKEGLTSEAYAKTEKENGDQCGSLMGEFMDKFTEKLKVIQPTPSSQVVQNSKVCDDAHLTEIITTVLHNSSNKEYNLTELLEQHVTTEQRSPQTRSRRRQEVLATVSKSNVPASCRELTWLDHPVCRSKLVHERSNYPKNIKSDLPSTSSVVEKSSVPEQTSKMAEMVPTQDLSVSQNSSSDSSRPISNVNCESPSQEEEEKPLQTANQRELLPLSKTDCVCHEKTIAEAFQGKIKALKKRGKVGRSRRNIVPPQRFSSYVTEPRKMYYAACFSESIFNRRTPKVKATSKYGSPEGEYHTYTETGTEHPVKTEGQDHILHPQRQEKNTFTVSLEKMGEDQIGGNSCLKRSPRTMKKSNENSTSPSKRLKCGLESQSAELTLCQSVDTDDCKDTRKSSIKYSSPIKLMLVSPVKGEDGIKYTLKAADSSSYSHGEMFDPCVEASWAGNAVKDLNEYLRTDSVESAEFESISSKLPKETESCDEADLDNHANGSGETFPATRETTPVKRRPGRPKKLGPQIEKAVKRPIGRPPKPKAGEISSLNGKNVVNQGANDISSEEDGNKNLKITIMYGRSRKARRVVSEDFGHLSTEQHLYEGDTNSTNKTYSRWMNTSGNSVLAAKDQLEDLNFVTPCLEDKGIIRSSSNIKCQKQNDMAVTRKPGRPPKVKISGISVTVTTVSPRQRKIHMRRDMKESPLQRRFLAMECESSKEQKTINQQPDDILRSEMDTMKQDTEQSQVSLAPVRHSVRERKPSIHLLHSVATARSFSRSNALVQRSHKLLMNSANIKTRYLMQCGPKVASNNALSNKRSTLSCMQDVVRFSGISVDSIFASNESLKWWPISASPETLNEELSRRIKLMSDTWVSDALEANTSEDTKMNQMSKPCEKITSSAESSSSAVKMLFEKNYSMEKLCSWFMQTTETQSLAIVKKVSARNRYEAFHYNPIRPTCSVNVCRSPQAERLRKHVKKFAKVVPKSPAMYQRAEMYNTRRSLAKTYPFTPSKAVLIPGEKQKTSRSCGTWHVYQTALLRARMKFKTRAKKILTNKVEDKVHRNQIGSSIQKTSVLKELLTSLNEKQDASKFTESKSIEVKASKKTMDIAAISREQRISSKAWSPETLKECRVFLKKINSPNTKLMTEECNICTVKFNISPAGCEIAMEQEEKKSDEVVKFEKTCSSSRKPPSSAMNQSTVNKLGRKRGSCRGESPPAKLARQSRSSRGVLGARWCDFVLGPSK